MVILHVKWENESLFLFEAKLNNLVKNVAESLTEIHNGCLKVERICSGIEQLLDCRVPRNSEQDLVENFKKANISEDVNPDESNIQNVEFSPEFNEEMKRILKKTISEAKGIISKEQVRSNVCLTLQHIHEAVTILKGGVDIVFPQDLPSHHPVRCEFENRENLCGTQHEKRILHPVMTQLWFAGKALENDKALSEYFGKNEKTKVIVKLQRRGNTAPPREPILTEEERKSLMLSEFKRREELKKMEEDEENSYLNSDWADNLHLKKSFHGINNISWKNS